MGSSRAILNIGSLDSVSLRMPEWRIAACAIAMCGIQVCYAAQINLGTSELLLLGISERAVSLAWLAGPLSGLIVQPIVGFASDSCTSALGRRRPFLLAGTVFTCAALLLFSNSAEISLALFLPQHAPKMALYLAIFSFFLLDFSIQAIQAPLRALVTDVVPSRQRGLANAYVGFFTGLGNLIGGILTAMDLKTLLQVFNTDVQALFAAACVILVTTVSITVICTQEEGIEANRESSSFPSSPFEMPRTTYLGTDGFSSQDLKTPLLSTESLSSDKSQREDNKGFLDALLRIPRPFWQVFLVQLCTWCGFFTLFVYVNSWVGRNVYLGNGSFPRGSPERETYDKGVRLGGKGNATTAVLTLLYALILPKLLNMFGTTWVYAFSQFVEAGCLLTAPLIRGVSGQSLPSLFLRFSTIVDIGLFGVVWATTMGVPWTLIGDALESDPWYSKRIGLFTTLFNASQSFPQLLVALAAPSILAAAGDDPSYVMFVGGICALFGGLLVFLLNIDDVTYYPQQIEPSQTARSLERLYWCYADIMSHADFFGIFKRNFDNSNELSAHADRAASWLGRS